MREYRNNNYSNNRRNRTEYTYDRSYNIRRRHMRRRNKTMKLTVSMIFALLLCLAFGSIFTYAKPSLEEKPTYKYYTSIQIEPGQTLTDIANEYITDEYKTKNQYINEVKYMNHLSSDEIHAGCFIIVPYYSEELL